MQAVETNRITELIEPMAEQLSSTNKGIELHREIGDIIEAQPKETRMELQSILDGFLHEMYRNEASDIDLGGPGCDNKIWYRVHGDKSPVDEVEMDLIESDFLLHNILMPSQREHLFEDLNLDFSYSIDSAEGELDKRFRADLYFERFCRSEAGSLRC